MAFAYSDLQDPYGQLIAASPADANLPGGLTRAVMVNVTTAGNLALQTVSGDIVILALPIGFFTLPIRAIQVRATGTTIVGTAFACY